MEFSEFRNLVRKLMETDLPDGESVAAEGRGIADQIKIGRTAFMNKMGVDSEAEYKQACIRNNQIMFHAHVGMGTWQDTAKALERIYKATEELGFTVDRAGICLDRRMGLPGNMRRNIPAETGPMLSSPEDWNQIGRAVPIQPHMGDFMIGFPSSTENTVNALKAGVTTIGNLSQYFAHEVPAWRDHVTTAVETVRALSIMSAKRKNGAVVHSYLEDGFGALFHDCATIAGWALLESYIVERLMGAKLTHCIGGLTCDPIKRAGWVFALNQIHQDDCLGSMIYGDTISFTRDYAVNRAIVGEYLIWDIMTQLECPTGHAVLPLPVTESYRVPSAEEIAEAQIFGHRIEEAARRLWPNVDFTGARNFSDQIMPAGKNVFNRALDGLKESGVDTDDPMQLLFLLKMMGPNVFEEMFGNQDSDGEDMLREPQIPSDMYLLSQRGFEENRSFFRRPEVRNHLRGRRMLIASTDVHAHAARIIARLLTEAGVDIVDMGSEKDPHEVADKAADKAAGRPVDAILISTHNGMALEYATRLKKELRQRKVRIPVIMGGVLNQKFEDRALPVDVAADIKAIGFRPCAGLGTEMTKLLDQDPA